MSSMTTYSGSRKRRRMQKGYTTWRCRFKGSRRHTFYHTLALGHLVQKEEFSVDIQLKMERIMLLSLKKERKKPFQESSRTSSRYCLTRDVIAPFYNWGFGLCPLKFLLKEQRSSPFKDLKTISILEQVVSLGTSYFDFFNRGQCP